MFLPIALILAFIGVVNAACDNQCSGHGYCTTDDVCKCYDNWGVGLSHDSGDCSERICPFEISWVDTPDSHGHFHKYLECAGRGICDRQTGECACFDGYEGKGCQRSACPNDCSGHGTCEYIEDLAYAASWAEFSDKSVQESSKTFAFREWDNHKSRACVCDATYGDVDCSKRVCPFGTDVLDVRDNLLASENVHTQRIQLNMVYNANDGITDQDDKTFALTFKSKRNETFTTLPIAMDTADLDDLSHDMQLALLSLPNRVIDGVTVDCHDVENIKTGSAYVVYCDVKFTGNSVQGRQNLLTVEAYECHNGCTPKLTGLFLETVAGTNYANNSITEFVKSDYNSFECGRRGKCDYQSGLCQCFLGYTGDNCNTLTTLV